MASSLNLKSALISTTELPSLLLQPTVKVVDASWHMPATGRSGYSEFLQEHIAGSVFFDIDAISDKTSPYPHMLPSAEDFAQAVSALGISSTDTIIIYDSVGIFSAPRVWWMFRVFGHKKVYVLDGGLPKWKAENQPIVSGEECPLMGNFVAHFQPQLLRTVDDIHRNIASKEALVLDARAAGRFAGTEPEPRAGLRSGHIEGSANLPWQQCITAQNTLKSPAELTELLQTRSIKPEQPIITSCGSGVSACILALALYELGNHYVPVYDGSWAQWGSLPAA